MCSGSYSHIFSISLSTLQPSLCYFFLYGTMQYTLPAARGPFLLFLTRYIGRPDTFFDPRRPNIYINKMATRGSARFKRESTVAHGLITPDESMASTGTVHPKEEDEESDSVSFSDKLQAKLQEDSFKSHHGLSFENHIFASEVAEHQRRSASGKMNLDIERVFRLPLLPVSLRSSYPPPPQHRTRNDPPESLATMSATPAKKGAGIGAVSQSVRLCVNAVEAMRKIGIPGINKSIPELVMVGDQSAGKSSLMSGSKIIHNLIHLLPQHLSCSCAPKMPLEKSI